MARSFNFLPFNRPVAPSPLESFSSTMGLKLEQYKEGENIVEEAKELFGLLPVAPEDQDARNAFAQQLTDDFDGLLEEYDGAYESTRFQRDAQKLILAAAKNEAIPAWQATVEEQKFETEMRREAARTEKDTFNFKEGAFRGTSYDPKTGYKSYRSGLELAKNHLEDARNVLGKFIPNTDPLKPGIINIESADFGVLQAISTGSNTETKDQDVLDRVDAMIEAFAESREGGNQLARKVGYENEGIPIRLDNGELNPEIRRYLANYLHNAGKENIFHQTRVGWQIPSKSTENEENPEKVNNNFTTTDIINNPLHKNRAPLSSSSFGQGLRGSRGKALEMLRSKQDVAMYQAGVAGLEYKNPLSPREQAVFDSSLRLDQRLKAAKDLSSFFVSYSTPNGGLDYGAIEEESKDLYEIADETLREVDPNLTLDMLWNPNYANKVAPVLNDLTTSIEERYKVHIQHLETISSTGYTLQEYERDEFHNDILGINANGMGSIVDMNVIDKNGEEFAYRDILKDKMGEDYNLNTSEGTAAAKKITNMRGGSVPLFHAGYRSISIGGDPYTLISNEKWEHENTQALTSAAPVLTGEAKSAEAYLPFFGNMRGQWVMEPRKWKGNSIEPGTGRLVFIGTSPVTGKKGLITWEKVVDLFVEARRRRHLEVKAE